jgi:hypothetical protein
MMKNKVKMLLAYFRALGGEEFYTNLTLDYDRIEDWNEKFDQVGDNARRIKPPKVIIDVIEELIKLYQRKFDYYNNYNVDEWWYLNMSIRPKQNTIIFTSECKYENETERNFEGVIDDYDIINQLKKIEEIYGEFVKIRIDFAARWDDGQIDYIWIDGQGVNKKQFGEAPWEIVDLIMKSQYGKWWEAEAGMSGSITIWGEDVIAEVVDYYQETDNTEMNIIITPDNVIEK